MQTINPKAGPLSKKALEKGLATMPTLLDWIKALPYRRNSDRSNYQLVFTENCGTCSTRHALIKSIAMENDWPQVELCLGFFWMNALNTPQIARLLVSHNLSEIPEAHVYLRISGGYTDLTNAGIGLTEVDLEDEMEIEPGDIGILKEVMHRGFIEQWIVEENISLSAAEIWKIRETCIDRLVTG